MEKNHAKLRMTESFFTHNLNMPRHVFLINLWDKQSFSVIIVLTKTLEYKNRF